MAGGIGAGVGAQEPEKPVEIPSMLAKVPERADFHGKWLRMDGGYRLEVGKAANGEGVEVRYFNPQPINVESAKFSGKDEQLILTVVLRDTNYPGSTYRLTFVPETRILEGTYTLPGRQTFRVQFRPLKE